MNVQSWCRLNHARILLLFNRTARAREILAQAVSDAPADVMPRNMLGYLDAQNGTYGEAAAHFEISVTLKPDDANTLFNLGFARQKLGKHTEAMAAFQSALKLNAGLDRAWFGLGMSLAALSQHEQAVSAFVQAAKLQPLNPHALYELGIQHHILGHGDALDKILERLRTFDPQATAALMRATGRQPQAPSAAEH